MMLWWCVAMIINAFERQQEIKELYQDDAYTILHIIHEKIFTVGYKKGPAQLWMTVGCKLQNHVAKHLVIQRVREICFFKLRNIFLQKFSN